MLQPYVPGLLLLGVLSLYAMVQTPLSGAEAVVIERVALASCPGLAGDSPVLTLLLRLWSVPAGDTGWLRLFPVACGLLCMPLAQRVARGLGGMHALFGTMVLFGGAPFLVLRCARLSPDSLGLAAALASFVCFLEIARGGNWRWLAGWGVAVLAAVGTHPGYLWVVVVHWLAAAAYRDRFRVPQLAWWLAQAPLAIWLAWRYADRLVAAWASGWPSLDPRQAASLGLAAWGRVLTGLDLPAAGPGLLLLSLLGCVGLWQCRGWRRDSRHGLLLLSLVAPALAWCVGGRDDGQLLVPLLGACILVAMGLRQLPRWGRQASWGVVAITYLWGYWHLL